MADLAGPALAELFDAQRGRLRAIAYRTLGSHWDADDAVQDAWIRLSRADVARIENLEAWLTTVVSRASIDILRSRSAWREDADDVLLHESVDTEGPESEAMRIAEIEAAMFVVLEQLTPLERLSFVLHDIFGLAFDDIAPIVERSPAAARQLASRARRRVRSVDVTTERVRRTRAVAAFLKASRDGEFGDLLQLLDPDVQLKADAGVVATAAAYADSGAPLLRENVQGADAVARVFAGRADQAEVADVDGFPGAVYAPEGVVQAAYIIRFEADRIIGVEVIGDPDRLMSLQVALHRSVVRGDS
jgi:RNA polymerase sigma-70 factor (ECF subfamily)